MRAIATAAAALAVLTTIVGAGWNSGHAAEKVRLLSGAAWLPSSQVGQLTLLDGASAEVAAQVQVASPGDRLDTVQSGTTGYAINHSTGSIRRVDGGTFELTAPVTPLPGAGAGLQAYANADALYALDTQHGVLTQADPRTLASRSELVPLAAQLGAQAATVDDAGRLWVLDTTTGDLTWIKDGHRDTRRRIIQPGSGMLVLAGGSPVLIDIPGRTAARLDPDTGGTQNTTQLDLRPDDTIQVGGSPHAPRLYVVASRGVLAVCDLTGTSCGGAVRLGDAGAELGPPVEAGDRVFVPDYTSGQVWIIDLKEKRVVAQPTVLSPTARFQLLTRDGVVFFNDPDSERAGVIRLDGGVIRVPKYDPKSPKKGLTTPLAAGTAAPSQPPLPPPTSTEPTPTTTPGPKTITAPPSNQPITQPTNTQRPNPTPPTTSQPRPTITPTSTQRPQPTLPITRQPQPTITPTSPNKVPPTVQIIVSKSQPQVGENITLKATADSGPEPVSAQWTFGDGQGSNDVLTAHRWDNAQTYQVTVRATFPNGQTAIASLPIQVTAVSKARPVLTIQSPIDGSVAGDSINCPSTCSSTVDPDQSITLTAQPNAGFEFTGWGGACTGTGTTCTLVMNADKSVSASFRSTTPNVSVVLTAVRDSYTGSCQPPSSKAPYFEAVISVSTGPATVRYQWLTSNGGSSDPDVKTINFTGTGPQQQTVFHAETSYLPGRTIQDYMAVHISSPVQLQSNRVNYTTTCVEVSVTVTGDSSYAGTCPHHNDGPHFQAVISVSAGPVTVSYQWLSSTGGSSDPSVKTINFPGTGSQQQTIYHTETTFIKASTYQNSMGVTISDPVHLQSNRVNFTSTCTNN